MKPKLQVEMKLPVEIFKDGLVMFPVALFLMCILKVIPKKKPKKLNRSPNRFYYYVL